MKYLSVCSGIEAATVAWHPLGWEPVAFAEIDAFPCAVLKHHYLTVPNWGDMTKFKEWPDAAIDVLVGGTPCQSFSVAGLRAGLADPRGNLALTFLAIADRYRPEWVVWENVPGVLSALSHAAPDPCPPPPPLDLGCDGTELDTDDEYDSEELHAFNSFLAGFSELGYLGGHFSLDAQYAGLAQRRERVFAIFHLGDWRRAAAVLFERESLSGHPAPRREAGERTTGTLASRASAGGGLGTDFDVAGGLIPNISPALKARDYKVPSSDGDGDGAPLIVAHPLLAKSNSSHDDSKETYIAHSLRADGFDASEDGTGRGTPIVAELAPTLDNRAGRSGANSVATSGGLIAKAIPLQYAEQLGREKRQNGMGLGNDGDPMYTLECRQAHGVAIAFSAKDHGADAGELAPTLRSGTHDKSHVNGGCMPALAFDWQSGGDSRGLDPKDTAQLQRCQVPAVAFHENQRAELTANDTTGSLKVGGGKPGQGYPAIQRGMQVRRLTPRECERLQGFPDDYTLIPYRGKPSKDGPRYKALGNSMAVPVMAWIGRRIALVESVVKEYMP